MCSCVRPAGRTPTCLLPRPEIRCPEIKLTTADRLGLRMRGSMTSTSKLHFATNLAVVSCDVWQARRFVVKPAKFCICYMLLVLCWKIASSLGTLYIGYWPCRTHASGCVPACLQIYLWLTSCVVWCSAGTGSHYPGLYPISDLAYSDRLALACS